MNEEIKQLRDEVAHLKQVRGEYVNQVGMLIENEAKLRDENAALTKVSCDYVDEIYQLRDEVARWNQVWDTLNEMGAELGDANKPLAVTASWALLRSRVRELEARCAWFGEGRGQCLLRPGHQGHHTCEQDGRQLELAVTGLAAVREWQRRIEQPATGSDA